MSNNLAERERSYESNRMVAETPVATGIKRVFFRSREMTVGTQYLNCDYRRAIDLVLAIILFILLVPLFGLIALGVRVSSPGPIFFRQLRHGKGMVQFEMLKFRTMYCRTDPDQTVKQAVRDDPRVTLFGRFLRRTSLDEIPQLFNVIKGEMSLIGPRPHAVEHDSYYRELIRNYCERFRVRPGITGYAQISGARGATPQVADMEARILLDLIYLENASPMLDTRILLGTVKEAFMSKVAY